MMEKTLFSNENIILLAKPFLFLQLGGGSLSLTHRAVMGHLMSIFVLGVIVLPKSYPRVQILLTGSHILVLDTDQGGLPVTDGINRCTTKLCILLRLEKICSHS